MNGVVTVPWADLLAKPVGEREPAGLWLISEFHGGVDDVWFGGSTAGSRLSAGQAGSYFMYRARSPLVSMGLVRFPS